MGRRDAAEEKWRELVSHAWHVAAFSGQKKLKPLGDYLSDVGGRKGSQKARAREVLGMLKSMKKSGSVTITRLPKPGEGH